MRNLLKSALILGALLWLALPVHAQSATVQDPPPDERQGYVDRFQLFTRCEPLDLVLENLDDDAANINLTAERMRILTESRLRAARLYDAEASMFLYVKVSVIANDPRGGPFLIHIGFGKLLYDIVSDTAGSAETWEDTRIGMHDGDADFILQGLSELMDSFVLEYLRVNEAACE